jgi:hypothetical protein
VAVELSAPAQRDRVLAVLMLIDQREAQADYQLAPFLCVRSALVGVAVVKSSEPRDWRSVVTKAPHSPALSQPANY